MKGEKKNFFLTNLFSPRPHSIYKRILLSIFLFLKMLEQLYFKFNEPKAELSEEEAEEEETGGARLLLLLKLGAKVIEARRGFPRPGANPRVPSGPLGITTPPKLFPVGVRALLSRFPGPDADPTVVAAPAAAAVAMKLTLMVDPSSRLIIMGFGFPENCCCCLFADVLLLLLLPLLPPPPPPLLILILLLLLLIEFEGLFGK